MQLVTSLVLRLLVCVVATHILVTRCEGASPPFSIRNGQVRPTYRRISNSNNMPPALGMAGLHRIGGSSSGGLSSYQQDEPSRRRAVDQPMMVPDFEEEEERYVPASFNIDDYGSQNGYYNGHAIEMMAPVEVPEYGWNEDSRGLSELENGEQHGGDPVPYSSGRAPGGLVQCGEKQIDSTYGLCCNGLVFRKRAEDDGKCCGSVAYDNRFFTCCQGRAIVRKGPQLPLCCGDYSQDTLPDQCRFGYEKDNTGLGSTCCRSAAGSWTCCLKGESCCTGSAVDRSTAIEVPGFRPACCHLTNEDLTAQCCATTYEKIRVLPDCCEREKLKPVCCETKDPSRPIKCCPGTIGYCCGSDARPVQPTVFVPPEFRFNATRSPFLTYPPRPGFTQIPTYGPRPTYAPRPPTYAPGPSYTTRRPIYPERPNGGGNGRPSYTQRPTYAPRPIHGSVPSYTNGHRPFPVDGYTVTPRDRLLYTTAALPSCCSPKAPLRQCCSSTKSPSCCQSARSLPRCCLIIFFNPACCQTQMRQHQQQQQQQHDGREVVDSTRNSPEPDVIPLDAAQTAGRDGNQEDQSQPGGNGQSRYPTHHNGHRQQSGPPPPISWTNSRPSNGRLNRDSVVQPERKTVAHSCCRLDTQAAIVCCRDGYQETGRLPACCVSRPVEHLEQNDADPTLVNQNPSPGRQELSLGGYESQQVSRRPRRVGHRNQPKDGPIMKDGPSKVAGRRARPCNETSFDEEEFICCDNVLRKRIGVSPACCNGVAYDMLLYKCCDGKVRVSCRHDYKPKKSLWGVHV